jgi:hypothetical protein
LNFILFYAYEEKTKEIAMCFGGGPSRAEKEAAAEQRVEADIAEREEVEKRARQKREDISEAIEARRGRGTRRSLFKASRQSFMGRFR